MTQNRECSKNNWTHLDPSEHGVELDVFVDVLRVRVEERLGHGVPNQYHRPQQRHRELEPHVSEIGRLGAPSRRIVPARNQHTMVGVSST